MAIQGRPRRTRSQYYLTALYFLPIPILIGAYLGKYFPLANLIRNFDTIDWLDGIIHPEFNKYTIGAVMLCVMIYLFAVWKMYEPDNKRAGEEYGSAGWGNWKKLVRIYARRENKEYKAALKHLKKRLVNRSSPQAITDMQAVSSANRILSEHMKIDTNMLTSKTNANSIIIGASGSKKTTTIVYTNIMQLNGSMVVCDPKGDVTPRMAGFCENAGYKVKILDLIDMDNSDRFNLDTDTVVSDLGGENPWRLSEEYLFSQLTYDEEIMPISEGQTEDNYQEYVDSIIRNKLANERLEKKLSITSKDKKLLSKLR